MSMPEPIPTNPAEIAFNKLKLRLNQSERPQNKEAILLSKAVRIEDVQETINEAILKYKNKHENSTVREWLREAAKRITHYRVVLDVFVQQHPEYVSLAWGTMKLLFVCVMNHENTCAILAKAISDIADRLPRMNTLASLFPEPQMQSALDSLYATVLDFFVLAYDWTNKSSFKRALIALKNPPDLVYKDVLERITHCSGTIMEIASVSSQKEVRTMHLDHGKKLDMVISLIKGMDTKFVDQLTKLHGKLDSPAYTALTNVTIYSAPALHSSQTSAQLDTNLPLTDFQVSQVLSASLSYADPQTCLQYHQVLYDRQARGAGANTSTNAFWLSPKLRAWSSIPGSSLVSVKGGLSVRRAMLNFSVDVIQCLAESQVPTIWLLTDDARAVPQAELSTVNVLKYLTYQLLQLRGTIKTEKELSIQHNRFETAHSPDEWLELFGEVVAGMRGCLYVVIDLATVCAGRDVETGFNLIEELQKI